MAPSRSFAAIVLYGALLFSPCLASPVSERGRELARLAERTYHAPEEVLRSLALIQRTGAPLSQEEQALVLELVSRASLGAGNPRGALEQAKSLEAFGKRTGNKTYECLGLLQQVYAYFALGEVQVSHELSHRAARFPASLVGAGARVKALLTAAQAHDEAGQAAAARASLAEALRIARLQQDPGVLFMATKQEAAVAIAAGDFVQAAASVDRLLALGRASPYREQLVRATYMESEFATAAGLAARAERAMDETARLMRELRLDSALGYTLVNYADFQLKSKRFKEAAKLSRQALGLQAVLQDEALATTARFNHAFALIHLGELSKGKQEVEALLASTRRPSDKLDYLPEYIAALSQAGDVDGAVQAGVLLGKIDTEQAVQRALERDAARKRIEALAGENRLRALEASNARARRDMWRIAAIGAVLAVVGMLFLYWRLRASKRLVEEANRQLDFASNRDFLTGLFNRRYIENAALGLACRQGGEASDPDGGTGLLMLIDIDHFKRINDAHGHAAGDQVLRAVAARLSSALGSEGLLARWGGEEFLAILPGAGSQAAAGLASRVLHAISDGPVMARDAAIAVTGSLGICSLQPAFADRCASWEEVLHLADEALYLAKEEGRNRAYALIGTAGALAADMAHGLRTNRDEGRMLLREVLPPQHAARAG